MYDTFHEQGDTWVALKFDAKIFYCINKFSMPNISDRKMDVGEDFVGKKLGKKAFLAVLLAVLAQKYP